MTNLQHNIIIKPEDALSMHSPAANAILADEDLKICSTCGLQFGKNQETPKTCPICLDDRQYVPAGGSVFTSLKILRESGRTIEFREDPDDPNVTFLVTVPHTGIGQCPKLVKTPSGYIMIECMSYVDVPTLDRINSLVEESGLPFLGIAISHPHWYNTASTWSHGLGRCSVYIHALDKEWWFREDTIEEITWWEGETLSISADVTMILCGGHFPGACCTHVRRSPEKGNWLAAADLIMISTSSVRRQVSFMWSYPNYIPLPPDEVVLLWNRVRKFPFEDAYCAWPERRLVGGAMETVYEGVIKQLKMEGVKDPVSEFDLQRV